MLMLFPTLQVKEKITVMTLLVLTWMEAKLPMSLD